MVFKENITKIKCASRRVSVAISEKYTKIKGVTGEADDSIKSYISTQLIGLFFGFLGFLSIGTAVCMDKWLVEEHLTARMGGVLERDACKRPFLMSPVQKHDKAQHRKLKGAHGRSKHVPNKDEIDAIMMKANEEDFLNQTDIKTRGIKNSLKRKNRKNKKTPENQEKMKLLQILNKPVATLAGFKGLFRECLINHNGPHPDFYREKGSTNSQTQWCQGIRCECTNYWTTVHAANLDPVFITVIVMVLTGLCLLLTGTVAGVYGIYKTVQKRQIY